MQPSGVPFQATPIANSQNKVPSAAFPDPNIGPAAFANKIMLRKHYGDLIVA